MLLRYIDMMHTLKVWLTKQCICLFISRFVYSVLVYLYLYLRSTDTEHKVKCTAWEHKSDWELASI